MTHNRRSIDVHRDRRFVLRDGTIRFTNAECVSAQDVGSVSLGIPEPAGHSRFMTYPKRPYNDPHLHSVMSTPSRHAVERD